MNFLSGYKTYILAFLAVLYAVSGYFTGHLDAQAAMDAVWVGLTAFSMRAAVSKVNSD